MSDTPISDTSISDTSISDTPVSDATISDATISGAGVHNAYPELPVLPFVRTTVAMPDVVNYISQTKISVPVKRAAYVIFNNESAAGRDGINNNYIGLQADGDRQADKWTPLFAGTCVHAENMTGKLRRFICFRDWRPCVDILADKVSSRGLYVGGYAHPYANMQIQTDDDWPLAYYREWVEGSSTVQIPDADKNDLLKQYGIAVRDFPSIGFVGYVRQLGRYMRDSLWGQSD
jgi:hypothetical protein